jgi:hypothetical protein
VTATATAAGSDDVGIVRGGVLASNSACAVEAGSLVAEEKWRTRCTCWAGCWLWNVVEGGRRKLVEVEAWVIYVRYYDVPCSNCAELRTDSANRAPESPVKLKGP